VKIPDLVRNGFDLQVETIWFDEKMLSSELSWRQTSVEMIGLATDRVDMYA
jgi:hypothetical protein